MSSQDITNLTKRVIQAEEELKQLKATQIIGGENMGYYEYTLPDMTYNLAARGYWGLILIFACSGPFPLCSMEFKIYENGVYKPNPYQANPAPYNANKDSIATYSFVDGEMIPSVLWEDTAEYNLNGRTFSTDDPKNVMSLVMFTNRSTSSGVEISFRDIKFRTTHPGVCIASFVDPYSQKGINGKRFSDQN